MHGRSNNMIRRLRHPIAEYIRQDLFLHFQYYFFQEIHSGEFLLSPCSCSLQLLCNFFPCIFLEFLAAPLLLFRPRITFAPALLNADSKFSSCLSSVSIAFHLMFFAFSRAWSTSVNCCLPWAQQHYIAQY